MISIKTTLAALAAIIIVFLLPRLPLFADLVEKELLQELQEATGMTFTVKKITLNLLPLYAQADEISGIDQHKKVSINIARTKVYVGLTGLIKKEIDLNRLIIKGLLFAGEKEHIERVAENVQNYLKKEQKKSIKAVVKSIEIESGALVLTDKSDKVAVKGLNVSVIPSERLRARLSLKDVQVIAKGISDLEVDVDAYLTTSERVINLHKMALGVHKSDIKGSGVLDADKLDGAIEIQARLLWESIKRVFGLKGPENGWIDASGKVDIDAKKPIIDSFKLDLALKGEFFLETLMELLKVTEPLKGYMSLEGQVKGSLRELEGIGKARLSKGDVFDVAVDSLLCDIHYRDGAMRFTDGKANLYKGTANVNVMIALPVVNYFEVDVKVKDISSIGLFKLINWDPGIAEGKVTGSLLSKGQRFNPSGSFSYRNNRFGRDILSKIGSIDAHYSIRDKILTLSSVTVKTAHSQMNGSGDIDIAGGALQIKGSGKSSEVRELGAPYFTAFSGDADFDFSLEGILEDPIIDMQLHSTRGFFETGELGMTELLRNERLELREARGDLRYSKNMLLVRSLRIDSEDGAYRAEGRVHFKKAKRLFQIDAPLYDLHFYVHDAGLQRLSGFFIDAPEMKGSIKGSFSFRGVPDDLSCSGSFNASRYEILGYEAGEGMSSDISYRNKRFVFSNTLINRGGAEIRGGGSISLNKEFTVEARGSSLSLTDMLGRKAERLRGISLRNLFLKGSGTFANPFINASSDIVISSQKSRYTVRGAIAAQLKERSLHIEGSLLDRKMALTADALLSEEMPWSLKADLKTTRYDFLISSLLKDTPEDLVLNLQGKINAWGSRDSVNGTANISRAYLSLYGNGFSNKGDIQISVNNNKINLDRLVLYNDNAEFKGSGSTIIGTSYDLLFEGRSSLSPFKALSSTLDALKGDAAFVVSIAGDWKDPKINGGLEVSNGSLGLKDLYYRMTSVSAYLYFDEDKVILSKAYGKMAGGEISLTGNAGIKGFNINRFFIDARVTNATVSPSRDFWINFDGSLYIRGAMNEQQIVGDITIKKGRYTERVDWKSWLITASKKEKTKVEAGRLDNVSVNVKMRGDSIVLDNNLTRSTISTDLLLRGTLSNLVPIGKIETREGTVFFRNNEFRIVKASIDFANIEQIKPYFNIVADTRVQNYNIRLTLEGFSDQFNLSLSSDPYLAENDILALLTVGQTGKQLKGMEAGIGAGEAASFLTGKIQDMIEDRAKTITGFDRIQIDPSISKTTSTISPRVTVSKRLMGDRLYVTYSAAITTGQEQVWKLEYMLDRRTSLIGVRDERGGVGADIKFRFEFK